MDINFKMEFHDLTEGEFAVEEYNYSYVFQFEEYFYKNADTVRLWFHYNWIIAPISIVFYVITIFLGQKYMATREKFNLRTPLVIWSGFLAIFSTMAAVRTLPELIHMLYNYGFEQSVCNSSYTRGNTYVWGFLWVISKLFELGDTAFIVLRKQKLIFLHWYHHALVLFNAWQGYTYYPSAARYYIVMNFSVHSLMYTYYTLRAMRIRIPKFVNIVLTSLQITQMIIALYVIGYAYYVLEQGRPCQEIQNQLILRFSTYVSFFVLFAWYFYNAYIRKPSSKPMQNGASAKPILNGSTTNATSQEANGTYTNGYIRNGASINGGVANGSYIYDGLSKKHN